MVQMIRKATSYIAYFFCAKPQSVAKPIVPPVSDSEIRPELKSSLDRLMKNHDELWHKLAK